MVQIVYPPAVAAMVPQIAGEQDLGAANAMQGAIDNLVVVVGPGLGALLLLAGSVPLVFAVNAASFALSALLVRTVGARSKTSDVTEGGTAGPLRQIKVGLQAILHSPTVALLVSFSVAASFIYGTDTVLFAPLSKLQLGTGAHGFGYLLAGCGLGGLLAAGGINRLAASPRLGAWMVGGLVLYCLPTAAMVFIHQPAVAFGVQVLRGAGTVVVDVLAVTALQRTVSEDMLARVFGVFFALVLAAISLGALVAPVLLGVIGLHPTLIVFGIGAALCALASYPWVRRIDAGSMVDAKAIAERVSLFKTANILHSASRLALERLARNASEEDVAEGAVVIREGDPADDFFIILDGSVSVLAKGEGEEERHIRHLHAGDYFGEIGLLGRIPRTATVRADEPCSLLRVSGDVFIAALTEAPPTALLLESATARLTITHPSQQTLIASRHEPGDA
jgi:CRP-like cAMP-binding protein